MININTQRPLIMGILNITPDSFSGDGIMQQNDFVAAALKQAEQMLRDGADILDIGGESTRPGSAPISAEEEIQRVVPVITAIVQRLSQPVKQSDSPSPLAVEVRACPVPDTGWGSVPQSKTGVIPPILSIDTIHAATASAALDAGATIINDISGGTYDPAMLTLAATRNIPIILMHNRSEAHAVTMREKLGGEYHAPAYGDVVEDVKNDLAKLAAAARAAGIKAEKIILDPGIGFGKTVEQNLRLINHTDHFKSLGYPILVGPSRKSFIGRVLDLPPEDRLEGTAACVTACVLRGANIIRVHDVKAMTRIVHMAAAIRDQTT